MTIAPTYIGIHCTQNQAAIISTGGAWGIDFNKRAIGKDLRIMLRSLQNVGLSLITEEGGAEEKLQRLAGRLIQKLPTAWETDIVKLMEHQTLAFIMAAYFSAASLYGDENWFDKRELEDSTAVAMQSFIKSATDRLMEEFQNDGRKFGSQITPAYISSSIHYLKRESRTDLEALYHFE